MFIPSCVFLNTTYFLFLIAQWSFLPPLRFSTSIFESITHNAFCHFATRWIYISCLVYKNIPCFFPSRAFRNCLNFLFDGFVQLHNNNLISLVFSLSNDSFFLILIDKTNKIWKRDEASTPKKSIHRYMRASLETRSEGGKMSNRVSLVGNYVDPGRHKGRVTKRGREKGREGVLSGKVANEVRGWTRYAYEAWSSSSKNREKEKEGGREKGGRGDLLTRGRIGWRVKDGAEKWRWRSVGEDGVALRTLLWKLRMWFRFPREQVSYSRSTPFSSSLAPLEARTSLPARHFLHATLAVDAANCKLISPLHFATRDRRPRHRSIFRISKRVESLREKYKSIEREDFFFSWSWIVSGKIPRLDQSKIKISNLPSGIKSNLLKPSLYVRAINNVENRANQPNVSFNKISPREDQPIIQPFSLPLPSVDIRLT